MKTKAIAILIILCLAGAAKAQDTYYSIFSYNYFIPKVRINDRAVSLQQNVLPNLYVDRSAARDMRWVAENDSAITEFWQQQGDTVLHILREFAGIGWHEREFDIYLVRYFPSIGSSDPLIVPMGGISNGSLLEAAPTDNRLILSLVFQLAKRMLAQASQPEDALYLSVAYHPLMRPGYYRLDNLAMLLAFNTCQNIIGLEMTIDAYESAFWKNKFRGREIYEKYFRDGWLLSPEQTLADWIASEPNNSQLVNVTRPPRRVKKQSGLVRQHDIEGLPLKGRLGFSVKNTDNQLVVDNVDVYRLAYACGLRTDDIIRRVDGRLVRNQRTLVEQILANLVNGGATLEIVREGRAGEVIIQPITEDFFIEDYETEDYPEGPQIFPDDSTGQPDEEF